MLIASDVDNDISALMSVLHFTVLCLDECTCRQTFFLVISLFNVMHALVYAHFVGIDRAYVQSETLR